jgi:hypothetical protein
VGRKTSEGDLYDGELDASKAREARVRQRSECAPLLFRGFAL